MTNVELSPFEHHALEALAHTGRGKETRPSAVGYVLWEKSDPETRKSNPSAQGLALFGGKFLRALAKAGLAHQYHGWMITPAGRDELSRHVLKVTP